MRVEVDLDQCQDHGQCVFVAPDIFKLDDDGALTFRAHADATYISAELDEAQRAAVEEAADICPLQAILVLG